MEELIIADAATTSELDAFIENALIDVFYSDDVISSELFEDEDAFLAKVNDITTNFAYLCDVYPDGTVHLNDHTISMFNVNSVEMNAFNLRTKKQP